MNSGSWDRTSVTLAHMRRRIGVWSFFHGIGMLQLLIPQEVRSGARFGEAQTERSACVIATPAATTLCGRRQSQKRCPNTEADF